MSFGLNFPKAPKGIPLDVPGPKRTYKRTMYGLKVLSPAIHTGTWSLWVRVRSIVFRLLSVHAEFARASWQEKSLQFARSEMTAARNPETSNPKPFYFYL